MRLLGLDIGDRKIGLAISDPLGITAQGLGVLVRGKLSDDIEKLLSLAGEYEVAGVVAGLPRRLDGSLGPQARKVADFVALLEEKGLKVNLWDERFTTSAAERILVQADVRRKKRHAVVDKLAAVMILQSYLDNLAKPGNAQT
ncbi:MAG: Holliday junction resolvase RuvX [Bacillota bacterium]